MSDPYRKVRVELAGYVEWSEPVSDRTAEQVVADSESLAREALMIDDPSLSDSDLSVVVTIGDAE